MKRGIQITVAAISLLGTAGTVYLTLEGRKAFMALPEISESPFKVAEKHEETAKAGGHGDGHGAPAADAHGGGHGAPPPAADAHGGGGHGAAPAADAHGAPAADAHGGGHGAPAADASRAVASKTTPLVSMDEVFANISTDHTNHTLAVKLDIELFEEGSRAIVDQLQSGIKHTVIQASREQRYDRLATVYGKLYYKEFLVTRLNEYLRKPIVRDVHFTSFFLQ